MTRITTTANYEADLVAAKALLADHLAHAAEGDEWLYGQCTKWLSDALNNKWTPGITIDEWAEAARGRLGWTAP